MRWVLLVVALVIGAFFAFGRGDDGGQGAARAERAEYLPRAQPKAIRPPAEKRVPMSSVGDESIVIVAAPNGQGRVEVKVGSIAGDSKAGVLVWLEGGKSLVGECDTTTNEGRCHFDVPPGSYKLTVGGAQQTVVVEQGQVARVEFRPEQFGSLLVTGAPDFIELELTDMASFAEVWTEPDPLGPTAAGLFPYLPPGEYGLGGRIADNGDDYRRFGHFTVVAGRRAEFEVKLPAGALEVEISAPGTFEPFEVLYVDLTAERKDQSPAGFRLWLQPGAHEDGMTAWRKRIIALGHGTYRIKTWHRRLKTVEQLVTIGTRTETLRFELEPKPPKAPNSQKAK